jgi:prepilin-type N-terminal cleavage/methylation domain-containing protein
LGSPTIHRSRRRAAFTLIEMLAVVLIMAMVATFVGPSFEAVRQRKLRSEAMRLASHLEFARQRTVVTGVPHRILIDLEGGTYRIEWLGSDTAGEPEALVPVEYDVSGGTPLPLGAPQQEAGSYVPIPGLLGHDQLLDVAGLETPEGWLETGESFVSFDRDGTASYTEIVLRDSSGQETALAVLPLDDAVRVIEDEEI